MRPWTETVATAAVAGTGRGRPGERALGLAAVVAVLAALLAGTACRSGESAGGGYSAVSAVSFEARDGGNWAGQVVLGDTYRSVASSWTVPRAKCNSRSDVVGAWVGLNGVGVQTVQQTGIEINCRSGKPVYRAWYEMAPAPPVYYQGEVGPGDRISASVKRTGSRYTMTLKNTTQGWTGSTVQTARNAPTSAEVIVETPTGAFPDFDRFSFSGSTVDGSTLADLDPIAIDASNDPRHGAHTKAARGGSFSVGYVDSRE